MSSSQPQELDIKKNYPLAGLTTLKVGGNADYYIEVRGSGELKAALEWGRTKKVPITTLGGGSNLVVSDVGFRGLVVHMRMRGIEGEVRGSRALLTAAAGEPWDAVVAYAVEHDWAGIENLSGIPGSMGGAVVQNINAYGQVMGDTVREVEAFNVLNGQIQRFNNAACKFAYRDSFFKHEALGTYILTAITLQLVVHGRVDSSYQSAQGSLSEQLGDQAPTLKTMRETVLNTRNKKGHVLLQGFEHFRSVGSFFTNPIVSREIFERARATALERNAELEERLRPWFWELPGGRIKISAAFLIEYTKFVKGYRRDAVGISPRHILSLVTYPGATAEQLVGLARDIQVATRDIFAIVLLPEAQMVGFDPYPLLT
ncbi:MAG: UDP-N-acetylmuramate dehydrogenase [bacterium]|nr:UDP-N-acetylmuramate dehydrogenase [bacterium]